MPSLVRLRSLPWLVLFELARTTKAHLDDNLPADDRRRLAQVMRRTRGDVRQLTEREKQELRRIARDVNLIGLAQNLAPSATRLRRGGRR